jgi:polysaccharide chain length determinant protein (PEP-CTERM system associated)
MSQSTIQLSDISRILRSRLVWILAPVVVLTSISATILFQTPNVYLASAQVLLEPKAVPDDMVRNILPEEATARLETLRQSILSRVHLEKIIRRLHLYSHVGDLSPAWLEKKIEWFRNDIEIEVISLNRPGQSIHFKIRFKHGDPVVARDVTQNLANLFIEFDHQMRLEAIESTTTFFNDELKSIEARMRAVQKRLADYKSSYSSELPEQLEINLRTLDRIQEQLKVNGEAIDRMESRKLELEREIAGISRELNTTADGAQRNLPPEVVSFNQKKTQLEELREQLRELLARYTEAHPDVDLVRKRIANAEKELAVLEKAAGNLLTATAPQVNPVWQELHAQISDVNTELDIRRKERTWLASQSQLYTARVFNTPVREQAIAATRLEYTSLLEEYDRMKRNLSQAKLSKNLENQQRGEQFKVIEQATLPQFPYKPNRQLGLLLTLLVSLGVGLGLAIARDSTDPSVHSPSVLARHFQIPTLVAVPHFVPQGEMKRVRLRRLLRRLGWLCVLAAVGAAGVAATIRFDLAERLAGLIYKL